MRLLKPVLDVTLLGYEFRQEEPNHQSQSHLFFPRDLVFTWYLRGAPQLAQLVNLLTTMEEASFPRGRHKAEPEAKDKSKKRSGPPVDHDDATNVTRDFLFGGDNRKIAPSRKKPKPALVLSTAPKKVSLLPLGGGAVVHPPKGQPWIEGLGFSKLQKGVKLLACVREVHADLTIFSLPNFWTGYTLSHSSSKDDATTTTATSRSNKKQNTKNYRLQVGQFVAVVIVKVTAEHTAEHGIRRRIQVSCDPTLVNNSNDRVVPGMTIPCAVRSIEDHGVLMDLGGGRRGFLPYDEIQQDYCTVGVDEDEDVSVDHDTNKLRLSVGRILDCVVGDGSTNDSVIVPLQLPRQSKRAKLTVPVSAGLTLTQLLPGMLVHAKVEATIRNGLCVAFLGNVFRGAIETKHLGSYWVPKQRVESEDWRQVFELHRSVTARIICVDPATKIIRLSMQRHLLELETPIMSPPIGTVCHRATVIRLDPGIGALLALPTENADDDDDHAEAEKKPLFKPVLSDKTYRAACRIQAVYVHISKAMDKEPNEKKTPETLFSTAFAPSTQHTVRILSNTNFIDGVASGATAPSIVGAHVLTHADLRAGTVYKQVPVVCAQTSKGGVLVDLGVGVRGLIPETHLFDKSAAASSDFRLKLQKVKYSVGAKVDVRVLKVDARTKKCMLTAKRSIVKCQDVIDSFDDCKIGDTGTGFVSKVDDQGLSVTFFNGVYGRVTARSLAAELGIENHKLDYAVGDVVQCRVTIIKKRANRWSNGSDDEMDVDEETTHKKCYREMTLSLKLDDPSSSSQAERNSNDPSALVQLVAGALLPAKSMYIVELRKGKQKENGFVSGHAIVRIKSKYVVAGAEIEKVAPYVDCKLPYDQLLDHYREDNIVSAEAMDSVAETMLTVGKKINRKGFVLYDPKKSSEEYNSGTGALAIVSIRPKLVETLTRQQLLKMGEGSSDPILPTPESIFVQGTLLHGYVAQVDKRHGAFVRFLNGLTGLIPKQKGGLLMPLYRTVEVEILAVDVAASPPKLLVAPKGEKTVDDDLDEISTAPFVQVGDVINEAIISKLDFHRAALDILDEKFESKSNVKARVHCTMADSKPLEASLRRASAAAKSAKTISKFHPFHKWEVGQKLSNLRVVSVMKKGATYFVELTNRNSDGNNAIFFEDSGQLSCGQSMSGIVSSTVEGSGLWVEVSPGLTCHIPALEISSDVSILNSLKSRFTLGCRLNCVVMDKRAWISRREKYNLGKHWKSGVSKDKVEAPFLSLLGPDSKANVSKPAPGVLVVGRINRSLHASTPPALMLDLRGGFVGRCCITELEEPDEWTNMPLGHATTGTSKAENFDLHSHQPEDTNDESSAEEGERNKNLNATAT
jgi:ribosomal protein S1